MIKRRARAIGLPIGTWCHTFRATGITAYLKNNGTVENAQAIAARESPRTTKLYDRRSEEISLPNRDGADFNAMHRRRSQRPALPLGSRSQRHDQDEREHEYACVYEGREGRNGRTLDAIAVTAVDLCRMVKRRMEAAGLPVYLSPHLFRVTVATGLLDQDVPLDQVQYLLGHADPRTTRLYDRRGRKVARNVVERISV